MEWIIGLPALGHTAEGGTVREWLKAVGDPVKRAEPVVIVESDKVSLEIEAPADGFLGEIVILPGAEVPTGTVLGRVISELPANAASDAVPKPTPAALGLPPSGREAPAKQRSTPLARRVAAQAGLDISVIKGSGRNGEIRRADVEAAIRTKSSLPTTDRVLAPEAPQPVAAAESALPLAEPMAIAGMSPMRRAISRRMVEAWRNQPMVTLSRRIDITQMSEWRRGLAKPVGMTAVLAAAMGRALARHQRLNGTIGESGIQTGGAVNLAVAVALDEGLIAPVIRLADRKALAVIDAELASLIFLARSGKLGGEDTAGATASLSNLGSFGIESFTPILTPPQIAVLGIGAVERNFREIEGGFAFRSELHLSLTIDHRAVDGADGARFLQDFAALVQSPEQLATPVVAA